ncbi:YlaF family protein [Peribacillus sp. SCS-37]|uniref:YlaF family protein n=1 Tax=Paraperibacillus esterisolvens TaxID=3115296 RepID=UPI00390584B7
MKNKVLFVILSFLAAASIAGIGIAIAEGSAVVFIACLAVLVISMGTGFSQKKKLRERGEL